MKSKQLSTSQYLLTQHLIVCMWTIWRLLSAVLQTGPVERLLKFIPIFFHTGSKIAQIILKFLEENGINIENRRGKQYDNAANMSDMYNGVKLLSVRGALLSIMCHAQHILKFGREMCSRRLSCCSSIFFLRSLNAWLVASTH